MTKPIDKLNDALFTGWERGDEMDIGDVQEAMVSAGLELSVIKPEWFAKFDDEVITDCMNDALSSCDGYVRGESLLYQLDSAGLKLIPKVVHAADQTDSLEAAVNALNLHATEDAPLGKALREEMAKLGMTVATIEVDRGDGRKLHYGQGRRAPLPDRYK